MVVKAVLNVFVLIVSAARDVVIFDSNAGDEIDALHVIEAATPLGHHSFRR